MPHVHDKPGGVSRPPAHTEARVAAAADLGSLLPRAGGSPPSSSSASGSWPAAPVCSTSASSPPRSRSRRPSSELLQDGTLGAATLVSVQRVGIGFAIGATIGLTLAVVAGLSRIGEDAIDPPMQMLRTLPHFGLVSLFIIWFGIGETPKVALIAMGATFPLYLNTFSGIRSIDRKTLEAAKSMHLTWPQRVRHVVIPGALPQTLVGLRQSLGIAWLSLIVAETISASAGLGYVILHAKDFLQTDVIVVGLAVYSLLGLSTDAIVRYLERKALAWRS